MRTIGLGVLVACLLTACSPREEPEPTYTPVPDEKLFAEVAGLPGVIGEDLGWSDKFGDPNRYGGFVFVKRRQDRCRVLDHTFAILRKGRPEANISVEVVTGPPSDSPRPGFTMLEAGGNLATHPERRYGPQPGSGEPPDDKLCRGS